jgi:hypothetical protein
VAEDTKAIVYSRKQMPGILLFLCKRYRQKSELAVISTQFAIDLEQIVLLKNCFPSLKNKADYSIC